MESRRPDIVILQTASNDLCDQSKSVEDIFRQMIDLLLVLRYKFAVRHVIVMQVLHRLPPSRPIRYAVDTVSFNARAEDLTVDWIVM